MNKDTSLNQKEKNFTIKLLLTVAAAFLAALVFRRSVGIIAMTPLAFIICFAATFIEIKFYIKAMIFGIMVFSLNSIEQSNISVSLMYAALCLLACGVFQLSAYQLKKNKKKFIIYSSVSSVFCIVLSLFIIGNPFLALKYQKKFEEHIKNNYPTEKSEIFGNFEFSEIYYNYSTKAYTMDAVSTAFITERSTISVSENSVSDRFKSLMESKITNQYVLEMTSLLRSAFPLESFSVECDRVATFPKENLLNAKKGELYGDIVYEIYLGGVQSFDVMQNRVIKYMKAIEGSGIGYGKIIFLSGSGYWYRRSVTIDNDYSVQNPRFETHLVLKDSANQYNELLQSKFRKDFSINDYVNQYLCDRRGICHTHGRDVLCFCK